MLQLFRWAAMAEGVSLIALVCVAMPLKYFYAMPEAVSFAGRLHGVLFLIFVGLLMWLSKRERWPDETVSSLLLASLIPFGSFYQLRKSKAIFSDGKSNG